MHDNLFPVSEYEYNFKKGDIRVGIGFGIPDRAPITWVQTAFGRVLRFSGHIPADAIEPSDVITLDNITITRTHAFGKEAATIVSIGGQGFDSNIFLNGHHGPMAALREAYVKMIITSQQICGEVVFNGLSEEMINLGEALLKRGVPSAELARLSAIAQRHMFKPE